LVNKTTQEEPAEATVVIEHPHIKTSYNTLLVGTTYVVGPWSANANSLTLS
jgi:hypothetical protein